jgi:hypothetical protein
MSPNQGNFATTMTRSLTKTEGSEAVAKLGNAGMSQREIAGVLGVSHTRDLDGPNVPAETDSPNDASTNVPVSRSAARRWLS